MVITDALIFYSDVSFDSLTIYGVGNGLPGVYNFTVINFVDGTRDSILFNANNYQAKYNISYIVNGNCINIYLMNLTYYHDSYPVISVDNIYKGLDWYKHNFLNVSFENLSSGVHTLEIWCSESGFEDFCYATLFEIEDVFDFGGENGGDEYKIDIEQNSSNVDNSSFIELNIASRNSTYSGKAIKNDDVEDSYSKQHGGILKEIIMNSFIGDDKSSQSNSNSPSKKSYEIIKKSASNSFNEESHFYLIIVV